MSYFDVFSIEESAMRVFFSFAPEFFFKFGIQGRDLRSTTPRTIFEVCLPLCHPDHSRFAVDLGTCRTKNTVSHLQAFEFHGTSLNRF